MTEPRVRTGRRRIYLMRHGHVDYFGAEAQRSKRLDDVRLTPLGREQARAAGLALNGIAFDRIVHSALPRTEQTTRIVCSCLADTNVEPDEQPDFAEIGTGKPLALSHRNELAARLAFYFDNAAAPGARLFDGGEAFEDAFRRATSALENMLREDDWTTALVVAHEGINRLILGWATGAGLTAVRAFEQDFACVNILDFDVVTDPENSNRTKIERTIIKAINLTPYNFLKTVMTLTSFEALHGA